MTNLQKISKQILLALISGLLSGLAATLLLILLDRATKYRQDHTQIIFFLPIAGILIGLVYHYLGKRFEKGSDLVFEEIHDPKATLPLRLTPFVLFGTVITHLFGGSAGREGTAVQMGAALSDQLSRFFKLTPAERKILLVAGAGAGFGAAIGAPFAGAIFGMEVISVRRLKLIAPLECFVASFAAYYTAVKLRAPHSIYPGIIVDSPSLKLLPSLIFAGLAFGLTARFFVRVTHTIEVQFKRYVAFPPLRPFFAGIALAILYFVEGSYRYAGLGISEIQSALVQPAGFLVPLEKLAFTALTLASGFKGGEFIPLVFIGTSLGSALSTILPISVGLLAALGFSAVFAAGASTPIACTILAMEIFGLKIGPYAAVAIFAAYFVSGNRGIYCAQTRAKFHFFEK